jgi:ABC-type phosphate/phosphonate transport system permease subunit
VRLESSGGFADFRSLGFAGFLSSKMIWWKLSVKEILYTSMESLSNNPAFLYKWRPKRGVTVKIAYFITLLTAFVAMSFSVCANANEDVTYRCTAYDQWFEVGPTYGNPWAYFPGPISLGCIPATM